MTTELLDDLIARLPQLRENGVTHFSVDPNTGAVSMILLPLPRVPAAADEQPTTSGERVATFEEASALGILPGSPMPRTFRDRQKSAAPMVK